MLSLSPSQRLAAMYHMKHISVGELLRTEQHSGSTQGELIARILGEGRIVPVEMSLSLLKAAMLATPIAYSATTTTTGTTTGAGVGADISTRTTNDANCGGFRGFLIDGFPRNEDNLQGWQAARMQDICDVKGCLFLDCTVEQLYKRLMLRGQNSKGIQKREDDEMEAIEKRFVVYKEATLPVIEYFQKNGMLWTIDGDRERDEVTAAAALCLLAKVKSVLI